MKKLLYLLFFCFSPCAGQIINNSSFEGPPGQSVVPPSWYSCNEYSTPDTQPGAWSVTKSASNGNTYISLATRGSVGNINDNTVEAIGTVLTGSFIPNQCYTLSLDLAFSSEFFFAGIVYEPAALKVYCSNNQCEKTKLIWTSPVVSQTNWQNYDVNFSVEANYSILILEATYGKATTHFGNILIDNARIKIKTFYLGEDIIACEGEKNYLKIDPNIGSVIWNTGSTQSSIEVDSPGIYWAEIQNNCKLRDSVQVSYATPLQLELGGDIIICSKENAILDATTQGATYLWNTGSTDAQITVHDPGLYNVLVSNKCETIADSIEVFSKVNCCDLIAPNIFTPNDDGCNDFFELTTSSNLTQYELKIFNRWGKIVYQSEEINKFWDGKLDNNKDASSGVYYWQTNLTCIEQNKIVGSTYNGIITLMK